MINNPASLSPLPAARRHWFFHRSPVMPGFGASFGVSVLFISLVILLPISALFLYISDMSWAQYWQAISNPRVVATYKVTVSGAVYSSIAAGLIGFLLAWITTRYDFPGRRTLDALVDLPFALPTAVAGLTLAVLFAPGGWFGQILEPLGLQVAYAYPGILIAMTFTSLPFVVRTVQPVLQDADFECEEASRTLGAGAFQTFWRISLPVVIPALVTGVSQAFIRSLGEFGAVIMIAGNMPFRTEVSSLMIFVRLQEFDYPAAAAIASVILLASLSLLFALQLLQGRLFPWQRVTR